MVSLTFDGKQFICRCTFDDHLHPRQAFFRWSDEHKYWYTPRHKVAARLRKFADKEALKEIDRIILRTTPWSGSMPFWSRLTPFPFQLKAARHALSTNRTYLALDPRLGKTIIAALTINAQQCNAIYICPPMLTETTKEKLNDWLTSGLRADIFQYPWNLGNWPNVIIVPDTLLHKRTTKEFIKVFVKNSVRPVRLFIDEAHRFKTLSPQEASRRGRNLFYRIAPLFDWITHLSGTPMDKPIDLWPVISQHAPEVIDHMNYHEYGKYYCNGQRSRYGWEYTGASNIEELGRRLREKFMLRIRRHEVVKDCPPKIEEVILIPQDGAPEPPKELDLSDFVNNGPDVLREKITQSPWLATYRRKLGEYKVDWAVEYIKEILRDTDEKLLVFAYHKEVVDELSNQLIDTEPALRISGDTPMSLRHKYVEAFQTKDDIRVIVANIQSVGLGFDLWKADRAIFVEWSWVASENDQAADRLYKIGKQENVFAQYLAFKGSLDQTILRTMLRKRKDAALI